MGQKTVNNIVSNRDESASTQISTVEAIAKVFGVSTAQLMSQDLGSTSAMDLPQSSKSHRRDFDWHQDASSAVF
ncbi:hypothetical protein CLH61_16445 [Marinobacter profundi]|uniref:HTH cro/C1-type domain-containing protein n=1 Tax=Marinobacter profundi TaxID=2666256 RepID=A0A2G1UHJ2_9GAMM|nr:hypothetical protein CLH61_16445 [Marinobacter profundi]